MSPSQIRWTGHTEPQPQKVLPSDAGLHGWIELDLGLGSLFPLTTRSEPCLKFLWNSDFRIGDGACTQFWTDPWRTKVSLSNKYPDMYKQCTFRKINIEMALHRNKWSTHFKENLSANSIAQFLNLSNEVEQLQLSPGAQDSIS